MTIIDVLCVVFVIMHNKIPSDTQRVVCEKIFLNKKTSGWEKFFFAPNEKKIFSLIPKIPTAKNPLCYTEFIVSIHIYEGEKTWL